MQGSWTPAFRRSSSTTSVRCGLIRADARRSTQLARFAKQRWSKRTILADESTGGIGGSWKEARSDRDENEGLPNCSLPWPLPAVERSEKLDPTRTGLVALACWLVLRRSALSGTFAQSRTTLFFSLACCKVNFPLHLRLSTRRQTPHEGKSFAIFIKPSQDLISKSTSFLTGICNESPSSVFNQLQLSG